MSNDYKRPPEEMPGGSDGQQPDRKPLIKYYLGVLAFMLLLNFLILPMMTEHQIVPTTYTQFDQLVADGKVTAVEYSEDQILFTADTDTGEVIYKTGVMDDPGMMDRLREQEIDFTATIPETPNVFLNLLLTWGLPIFLFYMLQRSMTKRLAGSGGGGLMGAFGQKSVVKKYQPDANRKTFEDVAGVDEAVDSLMEIVDYLKQPEKYTEVGAKCPRGVILIGPPGTGKTLIAKAVAGEAHVPFYSASGSEFVEMFVGRGASKVRELFDEAKKNAPCIIFIDEIDTIGKRRDMGMSSNDEREQTLNQLLTEMDGFSGNAGIVVLAATNRPEILDPALMRPGRFDRTVPVELPDLDGRYEILQVHVRDYKMDSGIDYRQIARATAGASGAQIANIVNEAALRAVGQGRRSVTQEDLQESIETVIAGRQKKGEILSPAEKRIVAFHEVGHALVAALQSGTAPVEKITIVPRTSGALGYTMQVEQEDKHLVSRNEALASIRTICGGRAAEEVMFGDFTTGASNDIEKATQIATDMVTKYGMSDTFGMMRLQQGGSQYLGGGGQSSVSPQTQERVDEEILSILKTCQSDARALLEANKPMLERLTDYLMQEETITGQQFMAIFEAEPV